MDNSVLTFIFSLIILIFSVIIHEVSHGYAALFLGTGRRKIGAG